MSDPASHDPVALLVHAAGRREAPPAQAYERALAASTQVWRAKVRRRRRWRTATALAAGVAAIGVGAGVALYSLTSGQPTVDPVAQVARVIGSVRVRDNNEHDWVSLQADMGPLPAGAVLRTEPAGAAALKFGQVSVRIADRTEIMLESRSRLRLVRGKVYVDTGLVGGAAGRMLVVTDTGSVSDVGTQFEILYEEGGYRVRVREGAVLLRRGAQRRRGGAGEQISIDRAGTVSIAAIAADDPDWRWAQSLAPAPDIDNQPLTALLAWVSRETGVPVRYATPAIERKAKTTILHGSIRHLEPLEALAIMLATTDLQHEVLTDGTIMIK